MSELPRPRFDTFYRHTELTRLLQDYAAARPELARQYGLAALNRAGRDRRRAHAATRP